MLILDILSFLSEHVYWLFFLLIWPVIKIFTQPQRLVIMVGSALANIFMKASTFRGMRQAIDYRMLPVHPKATNARAHFEQAVSRKERMLAYRDMRRSKKADREGPYAVQQMIEDLYDQNFQRWQQMLKDWKVEFDRREEVVHTKLYQLKWRSDFVIRRFEPDLDKQELRLLEVKVCWTKALHRMRQQRTMHGFWRWLKLVRAHRRHWKMLHKSFLRKCKVRNRQVIKLEKQCNIVLKPYLGWLHDFEMNHLVNNMPVFQADWASSQQTVELGRTLGRLLDEHNPLTTNIRRKFMLEHLPYDLTEMRQIMFRDLKGRVGINPNWHDEDLFETWLRVYYHDLGAERCPVEVLPEMGPQSFHLWVCQLVPPGEKGLAHQQYGHLGQQVTMGWLMPPSPNAKTAPVEVAA